MGRWDDALSPQAGRGDSRRGLAPAAGSRPEPSPRERGEVHQLPAPPLDEPRSLEFVDELASLVVAGALAQDEPPFGARGRHALVDDGGSEGERVAGMDRLQPF